MRKINKEIRFATKYKEWVENETNFPEYSASFKFHKDILYQLLICQNGLCAYSEKRLLEEWEIENCKKDFIDGIYNKANYEIAVDVEHFDSTLKSVNGWLWNNLFAVLRPINQDVKRKREAEMKKKYNGKGVNEILKPDSTSYNPYELLTYNWKEHKFYPNDKTLENNTFDIVADMIYVLGLNYGFVKRERKEYLERFVENYKSKKVSFPNQYITAFEMSKNLFN